LTLFILFRVFKRGVSPSFIIPPPPLVKEGDKGGGSPNKIAILSPSLYNKMLERD
jgi:hypothetical protein